MQTMSLDDRMKALHEATIAEGVKIKLLHASCVELRRQCATDLRMNSTRLSEKLDLLRESCRAALESINKLAVISQSH